MYRIKKVRIQSSQFKPEEIWSIDTEHIGLDFKTIENCKKVIEIAGLTDWEIFEVEKESFREKMIERSEGYQKALDLISEQRDEERRKKEEKTKKINELPKVFELNFPVPSNIHIWFERADAVYVPSYSSKIRWHLSCMFTTKGTQYENKPGTIYLSNYKTSDKKVLTKKWIDNCSRTFSEDFHKMDCKKLIIELIKQEIHYINLITSV